MDPGRFGEPLEYTIVNVVATTALDATIDCNHVSRHTCNCEYDPKRFAALKHRVRLGGSAPTFLVFTSGKIVCVGAKSIALARSALLRFILHLRSIYIYIPEAYDVKSDIHIQNIVAHASVGHSVNLEAIAADHWRHCRYEPELFPGLKFEVPAHRTVCNVFSSGKVVVTGARESLQIENTLQYIRSIVCAFRREVI